MRNWERIGEIGIRVLDRERGDKIAFGVQMKTRGRMETTIRKSWSIWKLRGETVE